MYLTLILIILRATTPQLSHVYSRTKISKNELTVKSTDPTMVARATTYSGKVVRMVHVFFDASLAVYAAHCRYKRSRRQSTKMSKRT